jgi:hypothetical protein
MLCICHDIQSPVVVRCAHTPTTKKHPQGAFFMALVCVVAASFVHTDHS